MSFGHEAASCKGIQSVWRTFVSRGLALPNGRREVRRDN